MKKLKLVLDTLQVQSFETDRDLPRGGTVRGFENGDTDETVIGCNLSGCPGDSCPCPWTTAAPA